MNNTVCVRCGAPVTPEMLQPSRLLQTCIDTLRVKCRLGCDEIVSLGSWNDHKQRFHREVTTKSPLVAMKVRTLLPHAQNEITAKPTAGQNTQGRRKKVSD